MENDDMQPLVIVSAAGLPEAVIDRNRLRADGLIFGLQLAINANDADECDRIASDWVEGQHPQYVAAVHAEALRHIITAVVGPLLVALDKGGATPNARDLLTEALDDAVATFGSSQ
ncbi:hypothetical protein BOX37_20415 [Nocardia mangyaensis]|uniref:Uncharacterized protein n=1 Tax=Nocardia mangyaensis TaxID=2213200 RepID=A0A1J0VV92_9NOCA|nr:hypothetical protein [Nocardia mangyaensis]APE35914.1 hypothetical protein BOX37_20415 [Nocardia mangyaensis]